jgi:hypothetical protein
MTDTDAITVELVGGPRDGEILAITEPRSHIEFRQVAEIKHHLTPVEATVPYHTITYRRRACSPRTPHPYDWIPPGR